MGHMGFSTKQSTCVHCEGEISTSATECPLCGKEQGVFDPQSLEESLSSLYTPPYQANSRSFDLEEGEIREKGHFAIDEPLFLPPSEEEQEPKEKGGFFVALFFLLGVQLSVLGLMQLFLSKGGVLALSWNAHYWFLYCLIGLPLVYYGAKGTKLLN